MLLPSLLLFFFVPFYICLTAGPPSLVQHACVTLRLLGTCVTVPCYLGTQSCPIISSPMVHQAPLSVGFPRQEYWSGLPLPSPGDLPNPRIKPESRRFLTFEQPGKPKHLTNSKATKDFSGELLPLTLLKILHQSLPDIFLSR